MRYFFSFSFPAVLIQVQSNSIPSPPLFIQVYHEPTSNPNGSTIEVMGQLGVRASLPIATDTLDRFKRESNGH